MAVCSHITDFILSAYIIVFRGYFLFLTLITFPCFVILSSIFMSSTSMQKDENGNEKKQQVIVVLEGACLETVKSKKVSFYSVCLFSIGLCFTQC